MTLISIYIEVVKLSDSGEAFLAVNFRGIFFFFNLRNDNLLLVSFDLGLELSSIVHMIKQNYY